MTGFVAKKAMQWVGGDFLESRFEPEDPWFEQVPATRLDGTKTGEFRKVRKAIPPGVSDHDAKILTKVKKRAWKLDASLGDCCGIRVGWSAVIGLVPIAGDVVDGLLAWGTVRKAQKIENGLPAGILMRMYVNVLFDLIVGFVPFIGDMFDAIIRANQRNAVLLERHLREVGQKNLKKRGQAIPATDPSDEAEFDRFHSEDPPEYIDTQPRRHERMNSRRSRRDRSRDRSRDRDDDYVSRPEPARVYDDRRSKSWLGNRGSQRTRPADPEMGLGSRGTSRRQSRRR